MSIMTAAVHTSVRNQRSSWLGPLSVKETAQRLEVDVNNRKYLRIKPPQELM
jgi:hypothetical protein